MLPRRNQFQQQRHTGPESEETEEGHLHKKKQLRSGITAPVLSTTVKRSEEGQHLMMKVSIHPKKISQTDMCANAGALDYRRKGEAPVQQFNASPVSVHCPDAKLSNRLLSRNPTSLKNGVGQQTTRFKLQNKWTKQTPDISSTAAEYTLCLSSHRAFSRRHQVPKPDKVQSRSNNQTPRQFSTSSPV